MKIMISCNQSGKQFTGVEAEGNPKPFTVRLTTPKGVYEVEIPESTIMTGVLPALRSFILSNAKDLGIAVTSDSGTQKRGGRIKLKK
jgi:hypothetical protein